MYNLQGYAAMVYDTRRVEAYQRALQLLVKPNSVVVDIGTGLGLFAFLASQAGARKVYAIESSEVIAVARELATINGYFDRIEFIENMSNRVNLPEPADMIVSDLAGATPFYAQSVPSIIDARKRFLKPRGVLIPKCDVLWAGVVNAASFHARIAPSTDRTLGLDMSLAWNMATNITCNKKFPDLLTEPQRLAILDYSELEHPNVHTQVIWHMTRAGIGHGISVWFDRILANGVHLSTAPSEPDTVHGRLFLPWPEPVQLDENDAVVVDLRAEFQNNAYIWIWNTAISGATREERKFIQSTFFGEPRSPTQMHKTRTTHIPKLSKCGESDRLVLQLMNGKNAIQDIASALQRRFPAQFPTMEDARGHVAGLSVKYSL
jgi:protein arginine N-methyltransferase 1